MSIVFKLAACLVVALACLVGPAEAAQPRAALVIGNADYRFASPLRNPANDARGVARSLEGLGFRVTLGLNLDKAGFEQQIRDFSASLDDASAAVFFYAGHGLQVDGRNYMVPVDARVTDEADLPFQLVALDIVVQRLANSRITSIVFLDACRDNPLGEKLSRGLAKRPNALGRGLATVNASVGTLISFSTQPGNVALDGDGDNSPFAQALLKNIDTPNVDVLEIMKSVRRQVVAVTNQSQVPWDTSSLVDAFFFATAPKKEEKSEKPIEDKNEKQVEDRKRETEPKPIGEEIVHGRAAVQACDQIAASASDPERVTAGVTFGQLNGQAGVKACREALGRYPNTPRFEFQLARSLHKTEAYEEAAKLYRSLVERGYLAALTNYGWLLTAGQGVPRDEAAAVRLYLLAAQQGDTFGMFNTAMAYDSGRGLPFDSAQAAAWIYAALRLGHTYSIDQIKSGAKGWTREFRVDLQRLLRRAGLYKGKLDGVFGAEVVRAASLLQTMPLAPTPGGEDPPQRFDPSSIPVNSPAPAR